MEHGGDVSGRHDVPEQVLRLSYECSRLGIGGESDLVPVATTTGMATTTGDAATTGDDGTDSMN